MGVRSFALMCFENEKPLRGQLGDWDWKLLGPFTRLLRNGVFQGTPGEYTYVPIQWNEESLHFLIVGRGSNDRSPFSKIDLQKIQKQAKELGLVNLQIEGESQ